MAAPRVVFEDVRKTFRRRNRSDSLRDALPRLLGRLAGRGGPARPPFVALDGVSFEVGDREVLGIVGANGAGKSTSLRLAAGVYRPDGGRVTVRGRISALIELSAGFHPDLSGRENIHLVGALHGMRRAEIEGTIEAVAAFADIGEFLESPVRTYSTGMAVRLGFSVASHVPADVLLVDEVLAVGDAEFQTKCLRRMAARRDDGVSVLFVSHNLAVMEQFCDRLLFVHHGRIAAEGPPREIVATYRRALAEERHERDGARQTRLRQGTHQLRFEDVSVRGDTGLPEGTVAHGGSLRLRARYLAAAPVRGARVRVLLHTVNGTLCGAAPASGLPEVLTGEGEVDVVLPGLPLLPGAYDLSLEAVDATGLVVLDRHDRLYPVNVVGETPAGADGVITFASRWSARPDARPAERG